MRELPGGSIVPVAQGVDTFIRPRAFQQAQGLPRLQVFNSNPTQSSAIRQGSGGDVKGFNQWHQLAVALAPFNNALTETAMAGGQMYAQAEYEKGRNDAIRAQILANQQRLQGGAAYAAENRRLDGVDPEAAKLMDRVNPFRQAGRDNHKARLAANSVKTYILDAYNQTPGAETWKAGDPRLAALEVQATQQILSRFGLNESSAGYQDYVVPEIAQAWDKVTTQQATDHAKFLKGTRASMAAVEIMQIYAVTRQEKRISWTEYTATGQPIQRTAALGDPLFKRGLTVKIQAVIDGIRNEAGLRGETTEVTREMLEQVLGVVGESRRQLDPNSPEAGELDELALLLGGVNVGPPESQVPANAMFSDTFITAAKRRESEGYEAQARLEKRRKDQLSQEATIELLKAPSGTPEYREAVQRLAERAVALGVPLADAMEIIKGLSDNVASIAERTVDPVAAQDMIAEFKAVAPEAFNRTAAYNQFRASIAHLPKPMQADLIKQFGVMAESKAREAQNSKGPVLNPILAKGIRAAIERAYPQDSTQALLRGITDINGFFALSDANARTAAARIEEGARKHMLNRLAEKARAKGERLDAAEEIEVATTAFNEYINTKDQNLREYLLPGGIGGGPGVPGGKVAQPMQNTRGGGQAPVLPPGRKPNPVPVVSSSNLDNVDPEVLKSGAVVLTKPSVMEEIERVLLGQPPSAAVQRAARTAGMPVGKWLLRQADGYPGSVDPSSRRELLRRSNQGQAAGQKVSQAGSSTGSPFAAAGAWIADLLLGTSPAMASQGGGGNEPPFSRDLGGRGGGIQGVYRQGGWGPKGRNEYADHHDIMRVDGGRFERGALDRYVLVDGKPLSRGITVRGGEFGAWRDGGDREHRAWDYAFPRGKGDLTLTGGARWIGVTKGRYGDEARFRTPDGQVYRIIHGSFSRSAGGGQGGYSMPARGTMTGKATYYTGSGGSDGVLGGKTANGETFTGRQMTAAVQWSLKPKLMNKWLIVEDVDTGRRIRVWANDTGRMGGTERKPADRLIDLSLVAFTKLFGSTRRGVGNVRIMVDPDQRGKP